MPCYSFAKKPALFPTPANIPEPGPYYTCLVPMKDVESFPFDYALYFSPDHHRGEGGIWLYVCSGDPTDASNWTSYDDAVVAGHFDHLVNKPAANPIHLDNVQGTGHTETPHANVIDGVVYLTYHKNGIEHTQRTMLATSSDGVNFARINGDDDSVVLTYDVVEREDVSDGDVVLLNLRVSVSSEPTADELEIIANQLIAEERERQDVNAIGFLFYLPDSDTSGPFTAGTGSWAPNGNWDDADTVVVSLRAGGTSPGIWEAFQWLPAASLRMDMPWPGTPTMRAVPSASSMSSVEASSSCAAILRSFRAIASAQSVIASTTMEEKRLA